MHHDKLATTANDLNLDKKKKYKQSSKLILSCSIALTILICIIYYHQKRIANKRCKKNLSPAVQVWEEEGGNIPDVPTPLSASSEEIAG